MKGKAVFFATNGMVGNDGPCAGLPLATITSEEWKALRLLTLAGYTIVLFTPDTAAAYAECRDGQRTSCPDAQPIRPISRHPYDLSKQVTPLLQATATLQIDLANSWMVGDRLDSIEVGRLVGCKTVLLTDGSETTWEMTVMRWPDLIAGDIWEVACLIVMSDGSYVDGLSPNVDYDDL